MTGDGKVRCPWVFDASGRPIPEYVTYHDVEWAVPLRGDVAMFERISLEAFQSGLSWLTILRKREAFRRAFADFDPGSVAAFDETDRDRLLADAGIVRNRAKIEATIANARAVVDLQVSAGEGALTALVWEHQPTSASVPRVVADIPSATAESRALARALKAAGLTFVGPTTCYALMQAVGMVNDHLVGCYTRSG
jgi:DNA-3-methyladenine glycosylase I